MVNAVRTRNLGKCVLVLVLVSSVFVLAGDVVVKEDEMTLRRGAIGGDGVSTNPETLLQLGDLIMDTGDTKIIDAKLKTDESFPTVFDFEVLATDAIGIARCSIFRCGLDDDATNPMLGRNMFPLQTVVRGAGTVGSNTAITQGTYNWYGIISTHASAVASGSQGHPTGGIFNMYGLHISGEPAHYEDTTLNFKQINLDDAGNGYSIWDAGGDWVLDDDNSKIILGEEQDAQIFWDGTDLVFNYNDTSSTANAYFSGEISATGYNTRTNVYDKSRGKALDFIKDSDYYLTDGEIDHTKFYGYTTSEVTDYDRPIIVKENYTYFGDDANEITVYYDKTTYPYKKIEEGVSLGSEISVLRQAVFELKQENQTLKDEIAEIKAAIGID